MLCCPVLCCVVLCCVVLSCVVLLIVNLYHYFSPTDTGATVLIVDIFVSASELSNLCTLKYLNVKSVCVCVCVWGGGGGGGGGCRCSFTHNPTHNPTLVMNPTHSP